jgi:diaminopimelate decarboxylase
MRDAQLAAIAGAVGTPTYVYDAAHVRGRYAALTGAFGPRFAWQVFYAVKANSNLAVLALLRTLGAGADIVSGGELFRARRAGFAPGQIVFSGVGKTDDELTAALDAPIRQINLESEAEADRVVELAARAGRVADVGIRVNPDVRAETHPYTRTAEKGMKFGVPLDRVVPLAVRLARSGHARVTALAMHLGSQIVTGDPFRTGAERLADLVGAVRAAGVDSLAGVSVGGGLGIAYAADDPALDPVEFAEAVAPLAASTGLPIMVEPGRFLVGGAGALLTRVLYRKHAGGRDIVITDAGMNDLLRPALYQAHHPVRTVGDATGAAMEVVDVVGPICETGDFFAWERPVAGAAPGALLAIGGAGAYGFSMSSQYNSRRRAAEVLVDGDRWGLVRARERMDDLIRGEVTEPQWVSQP